MNVVLILSSIFPKVIVKYRGCCPNSKYLNLIIFINFNFQNKWLFYIISKHNSLIRILNRHIKLLNLYLSEIGLKFLGKHVLVQIERAKYWKIRYCKTEILVHQARINLLLFWGNLPFFATVRKQTKR